MTLRARLPNLPFLPVSLAKRIVLGVALLNLFVWGLAFLALREDREDYERRAALESENLVQLVAKDVENSIRTIDLGLRIVAFEYLRDHDGRRSGPLALEAFNTYVEQVRAGQGMVESMRIADAQGQLILGIAVDSSRPPSTIIDRDYFRQLRDDAGADLVIGDPVMGKLIGTWVVPLARAIRRPDGTLAGVVVGAMPTSKMSEAFSRLKLGPNALVSVFNQRLRVVARHPELVSGKNTTGTLLTGPAATGIVQSGGSFLPAIHSVSSVDHIERVQSVQRVGDTSLFGTVGLDWAVYLDQWHRDVRRALEVVLLFLVVSTGLAWYIYRGWLHQGKTSQALSVASRGLEEARAISETIVQSSPFAIYIRDRAGLVTAWNPAAEALFGWRENEAIGKPLLGVPAGQEQVSKNLRDRVFAGETILHMEVVGQHRDGRLIDISTTVAPLRDTTGQIYAYLTLAADISARKDAERQIEFLAYRDGLTALPNRQLLQDRFLQAISHAERDHKKVALLFIDLDNFKSINDSLGHAVGDALLKETALRLSECVRESDTISRQGGDEFLIVLQDLQGADAVTPVLLKIRERLQTLFQLAGHELSMSASIGIAMYPDDGKDFQALLQKADTAMYRAKDAGRNGYRFFDEQMNIEAVEHLHLKNGLRRAVDRKEFVLHYQPLIDMASGSVVGAEALLRWNHPELGMIPPARFIPVAEDSGLIVPIGEWVMREACYQAMGWQKAGLPPLVMAVNLSAVQFKRGDVEQTVTQALKATGFDPHLLELELTESILIHNTDNVLASVQRLKQLGVKLSIDDFGTGYSSLSYLKRFAVDKLKIDQSFIRDLATDPDDAAIIRAIIQMARSLNLKTIAEGVETAGMLDQLRLFNCDEAQGYYFARPMPAQAFAEFLTNRIAGKVQPDGEWSI